MADFLGFLFDEPLATEQNNINPVRNEDDTTTQLETNLLLLINDNDFGINDNNPIVPGEDDVAGFFHGDDLDIFLDKFYLIPEEIDLGFITEDFTQDVTLLSLHRENINVVDVQKFNFGGAVLQHPTTPFVMFPNCEVLNNLTVFKNGQPFQNSTATYFIDALPGTPFVLSITGQRIIPFLYEANFDTTEDAYFFETIKYNDNKGNEQRRSLAGSRSRLELAFNVWENELNAQKLRNDLRRFLGGVVGVPIFSEAFHITEDPQTTQVIKISEDIEFEYNLQHVVSFVLIKDLEDFETHEIKQITGIDNVLKEITVASIIGNSYDPNTAIVYPVILGYLERPRLERATEDLLKASLRFKEFV